jgi:SH3-like domain-containing protein
MRRAAALAALLLAALPAAAVEYRSIGERAVILYDAPSTRADRLFIATRGYPFEVLVKLEQWTKVRDVNGEVAWVENKSLADKPAALVTVPVADVHAEPNAQSPLVFEAYKQVLLDVLEPPSGEWVKVRHRDGQQGYIRVAQVWGV